MNRQTQVLYTIFELELAPPFVIDSSESNVLHIHNKHSKMIGWYNKENDLIYVADTPMVQIIKKFKQIFNVDKLSDEVMFHIAKHSFNWFQDKSPVTFKYIEWYNYNTDQFVRYPKKNIENHE